ncbi:hypothetical protein [Paenibacillus borealis]|uniref:hypothetical protein n=1 Tax=Paenibacillus borealis TaxID=160799 RepID=UPI0012FE64C0|nr:hypothetical protein [Paenibacillus borealis]
MTSIGAVRGIARDELRGGLVGLLARRGTGRISRIVGATGCGADWPERRGTEQINRIAGATRYEAD